MKEGAVIQPEVFNALPDEVRKEIQAEIEKLQEELEAIIRQMPGWAKERNEAIRELNREVTAFTVGHPIDQLREGFAELPKVLEHLDAVRADLVENIHSILHSQQVQQQGMSDGGPGGLSAQHGNGFSRYEANLIVGNADGAGAPVVYEDNPAVDNLIGRVEHMSHMGTLITDFTLIKPGALHRANGGYLILDARKVLTQPLAWETLKRNLKAREISIESLGQMLSLVSTVSLEPEAIPLDVKVVLCGEPLLYYLLSQLDPEFRLLFKVAADFDHAMDRDGGGDQDFARLVATMARREALRPFDREAVGRVVEQASRLAQDAEKISVELEEIGDLLREADFYAGEDGLPVVGRGHVQQAIDAQTRRADRLRERSQEAITREIVLVDTDGAAVGQINGLSVLQLGGFAFGRPTRITARVRMGAGKVVDIEREVELGGPLHSKGVLILSGFLASRYALDKPLSLSASLVFEQSYGGVDGDSASSAELYVLLSALAEVPIKQGLAVTGSVNQHGRVQAIGGVNEKIEGFFDICRARGLTGEQGVLIPAANRKHLMLRHDVVEAVSEGRFNIYPVETVEEGIELLTGLSAGLRGESGGFPEGSVNRLVEDRLSAFADARRDFGKDGNGDKDNRR
jgi:lon-related putative ATP-dependent protease